MIDYTPFLSYKININSSESSGDWEAFIDALNGKIIEVQNIANQANGTCKIFFHDPISSSRGAYGVGGLIDDSDASNPTLEALQVVKDLLEITYSGDYIH